MRLRYYFKLRRIRNPAFGCVVNNQLQTFFDLKFGNKPVIMRVKQPLSECNLNNYSVIVNRSPSIYLHKIAKPEISLEFLGIDKNLTPHEIIVNMFRSIVEN